MEMGRGVPETRGGGGVPVAVWGGGRAPTPRPWPSRARRAWTVTPGQPRRGSDRLGIQSVPRGADGTDHVQFTIDIHGLAQAPDMHIDRSWLDMNIVAPHSVQQLLTGKHTARVLHEEFQQPKFVRTRMHTQAVMGHPIRRQLHFTILKRQLSL